MAKPWFRAKQYGYGAGLPISWEGWAVLIGFVAVLRGYAALVAHFAHGRALRLALVLAGGAVLSGVLIAICHARTEGGWRWRWGDPDAD